MPRLRRLIALVVLWALTLTARAADTLPYVWDPAPYQLGQGLLFPDLGLDLGGYLSLQYENLRDRSPTYSVHDLSLFLDGHLSARWSLLAEVEMVDPLQVTEEGGVSHDPQFDIERMYVDYRISPAMTLRLGKFLTPVGSWNLIHADPLVWTVSRPITATAAFARHATGAMLYGSVAAFGHDLDYWAFVDDTARLDPLKRNEKAFDIPGAAFDANNSFDNAFGGRLLYHFIDDRLSLGASYVHFGTHHPSQDKDLFGLDFSWSTRYAELSGEGIIRYRQGWSQTDERGGFVQAVVPLPAHFYLVGRHERYSATILGSTPTTLNTFGLTYRPRPPLSLKLEYRCGSNNDLVAPNGWLGSIAVLF